MRSASGPASSARRHAGSEPPAETSSISPSRSSLPTTLPAAPPLRFGARTTAPSSRCEAADRSTSWVSVSFIGILRSVGDGVSRRHHRSPALAEKPAGQDPRNADGAPQDANSDAPFAAEIQYFSASKIFVLSRWPAEFERVIKSTGNLFACTCLASGTEHSMLNSKRWVGFVNSCELDIIFVTPPGKLSLRMTRAKWCIIGTCILPGILE
jgi:hypothetical protein